MRSHIRRAAIAAALACAVLVPSFASARGGGGHFGGSHFTSAGMHRAGFATGGVRRGQVAGRGAHARRSDGRSVSRNHGRKTTSKYTRTGGKIAKRPSRGDGPPRRTGHRHPPRGPLVTVGTPPSTGVPGSATGTGITKTTGTNNPGGGASAGGGGGSSGPPGRNGFFPPSASENRYVPNEVLLDIATGVSGAQLDAIARRFRLTRVDVHPLRLIGRSIHRWRINDGTSVAAVIRALSGEVRIAGAQPNYLFKQEGVEGERSPTGDPAQYVIAKLHLPDAHRVATGQNVLVGVIDSGIDRKHPDLVGTVAATFDVLGPHEAHFHGTAMAGAIAAHGRLMGVAPQVRLLAVRSLDADGQGTTLSIVDGVEWAVARGARVLNMSFAGPNDPLLRQHVAAVHGRGVVMVAAAGNEGPGSAPLYPAADPHVIAVTATDADEDRKSVV